MGFFKKIFKGIKKVFKKIGKGIKSAFKKIGKFMGKIGIIGQIGLALILPGVGQMLSGMLVGTGSTVGGLAGALQGMGAVGQAASSFIQGAVKIASNTSKFFSSVSDGVTQVVGDTIGATAQSIGINADTMIGRGLDKLGVNMDVDGWGGVFSNAEKSFGKITDAGSNLFNLDPLSEISVPQRALKEIPKDSLMNEAPLREAIDSESALNALTQDRLQTEAAMARIGGEPLLGGDPFGPVGTIDGVTYMKGPPPAAVASGRTTAPITTGTTGVPDYVASETSLLDKASEFVTGRDVAGNIAQARAGVGEVIAGAPRTVAEGILNRGMQALGLQDELQYNVVQNTFAPPAIDMGSMTSIGQDLSMGQPDQFFSAYRGEMASNPYGATANFFNIYPEYMQRALT